MRVRCVKVINPSTARFVGTVDLDRPLEDLSDEQMLRLRHYTTGLADVE